LPFKCNLQRYNVERAAQLLCRASVDDGSGGGGSGAEVNNVVGLYTLNPVDP
jgi:hypothetical protein